MNKDDIQIVRIKATEALAFFKQYEHLGNCGLGIWHYALLQNQKVISVVSFGNTCFDSSRSFIGQLAKRYGLKVFQLARGGTRYDAKRCTPSQAIRLALRQLKRELGEGLIVAYSDTKFNEIGTIYQASNFYYCGLTNPKGQANYRINGKIYNGWDVRKKYHTRKMSELKKIDDAIEKIPLTRKHIYVFINASKGKKRCITRELQKHYSDAVERDYPKRDLLNIGSMLSIRERIVT